MIGTVASQEKPLDQPGPSVDFSCTFVGFLQARLASSHRTDMLFMFYNLSL